PPPSISHISGSSCGTRWTRVCPLDLAFSQPSQPADPLSGQKSSPEQTKLCLRLVFSWPPAAGVLIVHGPCAVFLKAAASTNGAPPALTPATRSALDVAQWRFCISIIRSLKKQKDASPFLHPVDAVGLNIPHYPSIVRTPMDLSTVERKLNSSNPTKPDPNLENSRYLSTDDFIADVRLIVQNCVLFNGGDHPISMMAGRLEQVFNKQIKNLPLHHLPPKDVPYDADDEKDDEDPQPQPSLKGKPKDPIASPSKRSSKQMKDLSNKKKGAEPISVNDVLTFEQKKDLSEAVARLIGHKLEKVVQIIHEGVPDLNKSAENIELEIDCIPTSVLAKLYNFVLRPMPTSATKRKR
ncbi:Bromodomain-containing protein, partial [Mycena leptocephala]